MRGSKKWGIALAAVASACLTTHGLSEELPVSASAEAVWVSDSNLTQAKLSRDTVEDTGLLASATLSYSHLFSLKQMLGIHAFAETQQWDEIDTINRNSVGGRIDMRFIQELNYTAPIFQLSAELREDDNDDDIRDATRVKLQGFVSKRTTEEITLTVGLEREWTDSDGLVFDTQLTRVFVHGDIAWGPTWGTYASYSFSRGDFTSSAQQRLCDGSLAGGTLGLVAAAEEVEPDTALDDALCGEWLAYRVNADAQALRAGLRKGFGHRFSADLSATYADIDGKESVGYERTIIQAALLMRI